MWSRLFTRYGISKTPNMSAMEDITVEGSTMSMVPSFNFCIISLSPPSWLEPYTTTLYFAAGLRNAFASRS